MEETEIDLIEIGYKKVLEYTAESNENGSMETNSIFNITTK